MRWGFKSGNYDKAAWKVVTTECRHDMRACVTEICTDCDLSKNKIVMPEAPEARFRHSAALSWRLMSASWKAHNDAANRLMTICQGHPLGTMNRNKGTNYNLKRECQNNWPKTCNFNRKLLNLKNLLKCTISKQNKRCKKIVGAVVFIVKQPPLPMKINLHDFKSHLLTSFVTLCLPRVTFII